MQTYKSILGLTFEEAMNIVKNDTEWFEKNKRDETVQRFIKFETDESGENVVKIQKSNEPKEGFVRIDKDLDTSNIQLDTEGKVAAFMFSVNGNKGPVLEIKKYLQAGGTIHPNDEDEQIFIGHCAWLAGNGGYGADTDSLCSHEIAFSYGTVTLENIVPDMGKGRGIFDTPLYEAFLEVRNAMRIVDLWDETVKKRKNTIYQMKKMKNGMAQDKKLVARFL